MKKKLTEPKPITCGECGMTFYVNHECDPEVLWRKSVEEQRDRQKRQEEQRPKYW